MNGYRSNLTHMLNKLYNLFQKKNHILSMTELKHWEYIKELALQDVKINYYNDSFIKEFLKYDLIFGKNLKLNIFKYPELILPVDCFHKIVFLNGNLISSLSDVQIDPWILSFDTSNDRYAVNRPIYPNIFLYLAECLSDSLIKIKLPQKSITTKPLYLLHIHSGSDIPNQLATTHYYYHINLEKDTNACIIEHFISINENIHFTGNRMIISADERSKLDYIKLIFENKNSYHFSNQDIHMKKFAQINSNSFTISGPRFMSNQLHSNINYVGSSLYINNLSLISSNSTHDIRTYLEHNNQAPAISRQLHKIIAKENSIGFFKGLIKINPNSIDSDAKMINNNLLLDKSASIYSFPELEIYSDAVQCSHGSTIGQIDSNYVFYLKTRGITQKNAVKMLIYAFTAESTKDIQNSILKDFIINKINCDLTRKK